MALMRWILPLLFCLMVSSMAQAENVHIEVSRFNCEQIIKYVPEPGVNYTPGVDVDGNPVAPADLDGGSKVKIPDKIYIDLSLPFKDLLNNYNPELKNAEVYVGTVEYDIGTGRLLYNGQELSDPAQNAIAAECRKRYQ